ncbi:MAG: hypothetical protein KDD06_18035 [Phaeodactylibacter sp.]|nr:hypothetical protein [Phaeodactylibacter sp.]
MPTLNNKRRAYLPPKAKPFENATRSGHTRKNRWTRASLRYRKDNPLCEVSAHYGITAKAEQVDHIIRPQDGGAIYDRRNLMSITKELHDYKTGREQHAPILVDWELNRDGDRVPVDRGQAFKIFESRFNEQGV